MPQPRIHEGRPLPALPSAPSPSGQFSAFSCPVPGPTASSFVTHSHMPHLFSTAPFPPPLSSSLGAAGCIGVVFKTFKAFICLKLFGFRLRPPTRTVRDLNIVPL
uniref:Uncharacterized protein n=1 Tax=Sphaerodactylus townsendi TaxID=933632 RepID=A0ACB8EWP8_9SAUR